MKISTMIAELESLKAQHGDLVVHANDGGYDGGDNTPVADLQYYEVPDRYGRPTGERIIIINAS